MDNQKYKVMEDEIESKEGDFITNYEKKIEKQKQKQKIIDIPIGDPPQNEPFTMSETSDIKDIIRKYVEEHSPKLYILTPCYGGTCNVNYLICLMATVEMMKTFGVLLRVEFCRNDSLVTRARNNLIAKALSDPLTTHVMFIDNDISWEPFDILKLLISDKPLVGGIYPLKKYNWDKLSVNNDNVDFLQTIKAKKNSSYMSDFISDVDAVRCNLVKYNVNYIDNKLQINKNLAKVKHIATGFMMMKRELLESMLLAYPSSKYIDDVGFLHGNENNFAYALFDCGIEDGHYFSEDWFFCHRWSKMNGDVYADVSINLTHTGSEDFKGSYIASMLQ
jgi:hypothetical protein